jgi:leucyl aminopeptidase
MRIPEKLDIKVITRDDNQRVKALFAGYFSDGDPTKGYEYIDEFAIKKMADMVADKEITGTYKEFTTLHLAKGAQFDIVILIGLGKKKDYSLDRFRSCIARAARTMRKISVQSLAVFTDSFGDFPETEIAQVAAEGVVMGLYKFPKYALKDKNKTKKQVEELVLITTDASSKDIIDAAERGKTIGFSTNFSRDLANNPGNVVTPSYLAETAEKMAEEQGLKVEIFNREKLEKMGAGGILAVAKGSIEEPYLIRLDYVCPKKDAPRITLVGKGITFDSGGISIKPSASMHLMKMDMHGAATVLGVMKLIASMKPDINVTCLVPTCENMPDAGAYKPGDIVKMLDGQHVEIINTDAEGRMLLADAISYAADQNAQVIIDVATLTGAIVVALGHIATGVFSNNQWLADTIIDSGNKCDEHAWQMPLFKEYEMHLSSAVADMTNGSGRAAGSSTAGFFLKKFTKDTPWIHLDIAGVAWMEEDSTLYNHKPYLPKKGATGVAVRTLAAFIDHVGRITDGKAEKLDELLK